MGYSRNQDRYVGLRPVERAMDATAGEINAMMDTLEKNFHNGSIDEKTYDEEMDALIASSENR